MSPANGSRLNQFLKSFGFPLLGPESNFKELKLYTTSLYHTHECDFDTLHVFFTLVRVNFTRCVLNKQLYCNINTNHKPQK
jgi:hypothetical protein